MLRPNMLFVIGVLLISSLVRCQHPSHGEEDVNGLNGHEWQIANGRSTGKRGQRDQHLGDDRGMSGGHVSEDEGGSTADPSLKLRRSLEQKEHTVKLLAESPEELRAFHRELMELSRQFRDQHLGNDQGTPGNHVSDRLNMEDDWDSQSIMQSGKHTADPIFKIERLQGVKRGDSRASHPRFRRQNGEGYQKHKRVNHRAAGQDEEKNRDDATASPSVETDPMAGETVFLRERVLGDRGREGISEEEESNEQPSSGSEENRSRYIGYEGFEGMGIYKFHAEGAGSFDEANEVCRGEGGHLAIASSKDEADVFVTLWMRHGPADESDAYVGIHSRNPENVYRTVDGDTLFSTGYVAWRAGEPDNKNGAEQCVSFFRYGGYRDIPCVGPRPFICELRWKNEN